MLARAHDHDPILMAQRVKLRYIPSIEMISRFFKGFVKAESASGMLLILATLAGLLAANSPYAHRYHQLIHLDLSFSVLSSQLSFSLNHFVNDGLMSIFFLVIGLEIKREILRGELSKKDQRSLPGIAALGGMIVPALIYVLFTYSDFEQIRGWAIPSATDIAFSLGILTLFGSRVPNSLKVFLTALAIIDDLGAVIIIALFYSSNLSTIALISASFVLLLLNVLNHRKVDTLTPYLLLGIILWISIFASGIHPTISGVLLGFSIPIEGTDPSYQSPLVRLERWLHPWVAFGIMPIFAFFNSDIPFAGLDSSILTSNVTLGITFGLFLGKQLGVLLFSYMAIRARIAKLPTSASWGMFYATGLLTGIGFTMSLFIGKLAFTDVVLETEIRLGVIVGSLLSAIAGGILLQLTLPRGK